jgi:hypothetical protein
MQGWGTSLSLSMISLVAGDFGGDGKGTWFRKGEGIDARLCEPAEIPYFSSCLVLSGRPPPTAVLQFFRTTYLGLAEGQGLQRKQKMVV